MVVCHVPVVPFPQVKVFALGREEPQTQAFLHGSLFGLPYKQSARWEDAFPAVSFSYDYYDRGGPLHPRVEQCTEALRVGSVAMVLGPDVVHRVHHFVSAFSKSLGTRPLLSQGVRSSVCVSVCVCVCVCVSE